MVRVGFGYDAHRFTKDRPLVLGGVTIPHPEGLEGHSDADVLAHAVVDALLGALGKGDIGRHFPDNDPAYSRARSLDLLARVAAWMKNAAYRIGNLDATVVAQRPRLTPFVEAMQENLSLVLHCPRSAVNIKATTTEGMGFCGRGEGMAAYAVVSLVRCDTKQGDKPCR